MQYIGGERVESSEEPAYFSPRIFHHQVQVLIAEMAEYAEPYSSNIMAESPQKHNTAINPMKFVSCAREEFASRRNSRTLAMNSEQRQTSTPRCRR